MNDARRSSCDTPIAWHELVEYWAGDLDASEVDRIDEHLFGCEPCSASSAGIAAIVGAFRSEIPAVVSAEQVRALSAHGMTIIENRFAPGERAQAVFPEGVDVLVHRLGGLELADAERVHVVVRLEQGDVIVEEPFAPFDADAGEVLIACQRHFAAFPPDIVIDVRAYRAGEAAPTVATFPIPHAFG